MPHRQTDELSGPVGTGPQHPPTVPASILAVDAVVVLIMACGVNRLENALNRATWAADPALPSVPMKVPLVEWIPLMVSESSTEFDVLSISAVLSL